MPCPAFPHPKPLTVSFFLVVTVPCLSHLLALSLPEPLLMDDTVRPPPPADLFTCSCKLSFSPVACASQHLLCLPHRLSSLFPSHHSVLSCLSDVPCHPWATLVLSRFLARNPLSWLLPSQGHCPTRDFLPCLATYPLLVCRLSSLLRVNPCERSSRCHPGLAVSCDGQKEMNSYGPSREPILHYDLISS